MYIYVVFLLFEIMKNNSINVILIKSHKKCLEVYFKIFKIHKFKWPRRMCIYGVMSKGVGYPFNRHEFKTA